MKMRSISIPQSVQSNISKHYNVNKSSEFRDINQEIITEMADSSCFLTVETNFYSIQEINKFQKFNKLKVHNDGSTAQIKYILTNNVQLCEKPISILSLEFIEDYNQIFCFKV
jgi:hypothetical protein